MSEVEWMDIFATNLSEILKEQGMTQKELANEIGVTEACISSYINKKRIPSLQVAIKMCCLLGLSMDDFVIFGDTLE